ncbi:hypothetical protein C0V97_04065 [Asaia sp. W19]|uniref:hypothetical protein n=1 Tax=unclassified Asaia TaxID=2685023 RepID=UPI000F8F3FEB|nr:hypothetical protein [Asaia sp. W19]RUT26863.1 hypothetical protein C0V97_04065 [Asaia sp. W19]
MKNPANPGDFGTNGIRGVVGSGMDEDKIIGVLAAAGWLISLVFAGLAAYLGDGGISGVLTVAAVWFGIPSAVVGLVLLARVA